MLSCKFDTKKCYMLHLNILFTRIKIHMIAIELYMLRYTTLHNKFQFNIIKNITNIIATTTTRVVICVCTSTHM